MKSRISKIIDAEKLSPAKFADMIGVQRSSISHVLSGRNKPSLDFIQKILREFKNLNTDWLLFGHGNMYKMEDNPEAKEEKLLHKQIDKTEIEKTEAIKTEKTAKKTIERIVIFYSDKTFTEYIP